MNPVEGNSDQPETQGTTPRAVSRSGKPIAIIVGLLVVWSLLMALGMDGYRSIWRYLSGAPAESIDLRQPLMVLGTMGTFLTIWMLALLSKSRR